jgi:hypothetical protein
MVGSPARNANGGNDLVKMKRLGSEAIAARPRASTRDLPLAKARERAEAPTVRPSLARAELLDKPTRARFEQEIEAALRRRSVGEAKLAGAIRAVAPLSPALRTSLGEATSVLLGRGAFHRELYICGLRTLAEAQDRQAVSLLRSALADDEAGGAAALSAACFARDPELSVPLAKIAASRQSHLAFGAELARVARGESNGALLAQLAPMIKESHRISMCIELFVPLVRTTVLGKHVGSALSVLRGAERHLGRWLVLAEVAVRAGDLTPLEEARTRADSGPSSSRAAWSLVLWALRDIDAAVHGGAPPVAPVTRPTLELVARLSDRPSADRDTTFLFRMARAGAPSARPMLESLVRSLPLADEAAVRAALYLVRDRGRDDMCEALSQAAMSGKNEEIRGMAAAALWDAAPSLAPDRASQLRALATDAAEDLLSSRVVGNWAWGALVRAAAKGGQGAQPLVTETPFRWIQWGWLE